MRNRFIYFIVLLLTLTFFPEKGFTTNDVHEKIVSEAKDHLGTPYVFGGTTPKGFDCSGYLSYVFKQFDILLPRISTDQYNAGTSVTQADLQIGDLVFFETYRRGPSHSGIYVGNREFIHASSKGVVISSLDDPHYWSSRYLGARRVLPEIKVFAKLPLGNYHDVPETHWAQKEIRTLSLEEIVTGDENSFYFPDKALTRADASYMIAKAKGLSLHTNKTDFNDVPSTHWAASSIAAVTAAGYLRGFDENRFGPDEILTRQQVAVLFNRAFQFTSDKEPVVFTDVPTTHWAYQDIQLLAANNITTGYDDQTFRPGNHIRKAEFTVFLFRALKK